MVCCGCWEFLWCVVGVGSFCGVLWVLAFQWCVVGVGVSVGVGSFCGVLWVLEFLWCVVAVGVSVVCCGCWSFCGVL